MGIKTIPLNLLEKNLQATIKECADSGIPVVVELPDKRLVAIQSLDADEDDSLIDDLMRSSPKFRALVAKSKAGPRKNFATGTPSRKRTGAS